MSPERDDENQPTERPVPDVFDAGEQPTAEEVTNEPVDPDVWVQRSGDGVEVVGGTAGDESSAEIPQLAPDAD